MLRQLKLQLLESRINDAQKDGVIYVWYDHGSTIKFLFIILWVRLLRVEICLQNESSFVRSFDVSKSMMFVAICYEKCSALRKF